MEAEILFPLTTMKVRASVIELDMSAKRNKTKRRGLALLVVLIIVMTITVLSLGFLSQSNVELACGENMILKTQMDYLAESALEHAKGLILNPQDVASEYWTGATGQQLVAGSDDYYDVSVTKLGELNYRITSTGYREKGGQKIGSSSLTAELRLDPCIAARAGSQWITEFGTTVNGDVYAKGDLKGVGDINGDAFAAGTISAVNIEGQKYAGVADADAPVSYSNLAIDDFQPQYYIGSDSYNCWIIMVSDLSDLTIGPYGGNPKGVYYRHGNLTLHNNVVITGTLVVKDDLIIRGRGNSITAMKNFPAVIVGDELEMNNNAQLAITGLAQVKKEVKHTGGSGASLSVFGALSIKDSNINGFGLSADIIVITAAPDKAAIEIWPEPDTAQRWSPAAGAFFKGIERQ